MNLIDEKPLWPKKVSVDVSPDDLQELLMDVSEAWDLAQSAKARAKLTEILSLLGRLVEMANLKFPDAKDVTANKPSVWCADDRILELYNLEHKGNRAEYVSETVRDWFRAEAVKRGWDVIEFPMNFPWPTQYAGAYLKKNF